ncbi:MAG: glutamate--tRNA ligase [Methanomicrobiales archaeon]|nr:glutamate--tRNA ligase [Methanomicrobiales archaeon]
MLFKLALQNAVRHGAVPRGGAVLSRAIGVHPELKSRAREIAGMIDLVIGEVASLTEVERVKLLMERYPELMEELHETREHVRELPALEDVDKGVVMRFAPNPSGPLHLGHARAAILNDAYVRRYGGRYILRIEDTDPKRVDPGAYEMVREDLEWLGIHIDEIVYQSDRLDIYYEKCHELIEMGGAYVCTCDPEYFRMLKLSRKPCPCRGKSPVENLVLWEGMLAGEFSEGSVTVRVKTELENPDPAMRDFPAFRIVESPPHPHVDAKVFPLMNFSVAVDDHLLGITHVIRGKDHIANTERQRYIFDYFGWRPPHYRHYGRMSIEGVVLSTSQMRRGIADGLFSGWDDISLGTIRAIARRGIEASAVREAILDIGIGETDISFSWENLYAKNREIVDPKANRYFFVPNPVRSRIEGAGRRIATPLLHPANPERGTRILHFDGGVLLPEEEIGAGGFFRLKDLFNVNISRENGTLVVRYAGDSLADARKAKAPVIQWLPAGEERPCLLHTPEGERRGSCETMVESELGRMVQFERIGFARIDRITEKGIEAYFAHR